VTSSLINLELSPLGLLAPAPLPVLKVVTPVHERATGNIEATAELYFAGAGLIGLEHEAEWRVWISLAAIGLLAIGALFVLVDRAGRTIAAQRQSLATSLAASQRLAGENGRLRQQANVANEQLLARVGSDLHDGPLQLLALLILKLSRRDAVPPDANTALAQQAMEELRNISAGLVLPEVSGLTPAETIALAVSRHENLTGAVVETRIAALPEQLSPDLNVCIHRAVQEGLANAYRHGRAGSAMLSAHVKNGEMVIEILNDLESTPVRSRVHASPQLGLDGLRTRLEAVGGRYVFAVREGQAVLTVTMPLSP
jgi:hypothetical protein